ncbi:amidohydrolase family protein [Hamadaea tsunoensis]|uniref:amidohydrolase family protein n=1 Tax=Hamadaea tsunoensis TaxID=53368 RepID=UPI00041478E0|nr:amidohydrolase family protein [Hamadaea tsunoensis]
MIDAHHHLWTSSYAWLQDPGLAAIRRDYTTADLLSTLDGAGVERTVLVEAARCDDGETTEFLALAARTPRIAGVVGWADPADPGLAGKLAAHRAGPGGDKLVGIRAQAQGFGDGYLTDPAVVRGIATVADAGLAFDLVIRAAQLPSAAALARALPGARLVLDHLGKPPIAAGGFDAWRRDLDALAAYPGVTAKFSGLVTEADPAGWALDDLRPYASAALELFGPDRLIWGSDWPVVDLAGGYRRWLAAALDLIPEDLHAAVFGGTAVRTYGLD